MQIKKSKIYKISFLAVGVLFILTANFIRMGIPLLHVLSEDQRNDGIKVIAYYDTLIIPDSIIFDLWDVSVNNSSADVMRVFLQFSETLKERNFSKIYLSFRGSKKFYIQGAYFKTLGNEYNTQNPIYTLRTFPQHLLKLDDSVAYLNWSGGLIGVFSAEIKDLNDFQNIWYIREINQE